MAVYVATSVQYAQPADLLNYGLSAAALAHPSTGNAQQISALLSASAEIDGNLAAQWTLPITQYSDDLVQCCCYLATFNLIMLRGFDPENVADRIYKQRYDMMIDKLKRAQSDKYVFSRIVDSSSGAGEGEIEPPAAPEVLSPAPVNCITGNQTRGTYAR